MICEEQLAMISDYIRCELEHNEAEMRVHIRAKLRFDPAFTHNGELEEADPAELEAAVAARLYDISGMEIDSDAGIGFSYGHMFAMSDLQHFIDLLERDPAEARLIYDRKCGTHSGMIAISQHTDSDNARIDS